MASDPPPDLILRAKSARRGSVAYICGAALSIWTLLFIGWELYEWSGGEMTKLVTALILWPLVWLLIFVGVVLSSFALTAFLERIFRLKAGVSSIIVAVIILLVPSVLSLYLFVYDADGSRWLSIIWFAGLVLAAIGCGIAGSKKRDETATTRHKKTGQSDKTRPVDD